MTQGLRTLAVRSGAVVGVYEYGDPGGEPVLAFHGVPACGAGFSFADVPARERRLRVLAPDRPGVGLSTAVDGWTVASYPSMVAELAEALELERFAVWGYSGGGPYAVACAALLPERVSRAAISAGMGQVGVWASDDDFEKTDRRMLALARKRPLLARMTLAALARLARVRPRAAIKGFAEQLSASDRLVLLDSGPPRETLALFTQAFLRGARGVVDDYRSVGRSWDIDLAGIRVPLKVFQGDADPMVPVRHARELADRIVGAELVIWLGEGHLATVTHVEEILDWLAAG